MSATVMYVPDTIRTIAVYCSHNRSCKSLMLLRFFRSYIATIPNLRTNLRSTAPAMSVCVCVCVCVSQTYARCNVIFASMARNERQHRVYARLQYCFGVRQLNWSAVQYYTGGAWPKGTVSPNKRKSTHIRHKTSQNTGNSIWTR